MRLRKCLQAQWKTLGGPGRTEPHAESQSYLPCPSVLRAGGFVAGEGRSASDPRPEVSGPGPGFSTSGQRRVREGHGAHYISVFLAPRTARGVCFICRHLGISDGLRSLTPRKPSLDWPRPPQWDRHSVSLRGCLARPQPPGAAGRGFPAGPGPSQTPPWLVHQGLARKKASHNGSSGLFSEIESKCISR